VVAPISSLPKVLWRRELSKMKLYYVVIMNQHSSPSSKVFKQYLLGCFVDLALPGSIATEYITGSALYVRRQDDDKEYFEQHC
jgi:hypothetical protein